MARMVLIGTFSRVSWNVDATQVSDVCVSLDSFMPTFHYYSDFPETFVTGKSSTATWYVTKTSRLRMEIIFIKIVKKPVTKQFNLILTKGRRHLENGYDVIFFCRGWSDLDTMSETVAE